jgi:hypothetical protein
LCEGGIALVEDVFGWGEGPYLFIDVSKMKWMEGEGTGNGKGKGKRNVPP